MEDQKSKCFMSDIHNSSCLDEVQVPGQALLHARDVSDKLAFCFVSAGLSTGKHSRYVSLADMIPFMQC